MLGFLAGIMLGDIRKPNPSSDQGPPSLVSARMVLSSFFIFVFTFIGTHFFPVPRSSKAVILSLNGAEIFDKKPSFSSVDVYARIASFPEKGLNLYKEFTYTVDILFPITLFTFLASLSLYVSATTINRKHIRIGLLAIPVVWFSLDLIENAIIYSLLDSFPAKNYFLSSILGYVTITKFCFLLLSIAGPVVIKVSKGKLRH
jgi:hypothetical protein